MTVHKESGLPLVEGLDSVMDLPHTLTYAILYRSQLDSFNELPKEKRPPRKLWDRPHELSEYLSHVWDTPEEKKKTNSEYYVYDLEDVE